MKCGVCYFSSRRGSSTLLVVAALAAISAASLAMHKQLEGSMQKQGARTSVLAWQAFTQSVQTVIGDPETCKSALGGAVVSTDWSNLSLATGLWGKPGPIQAGFTASAYVKVGAVRGRVAPPPPGGDVIRRSATVGSRLRVRPMTLSFQSAGRAPLNLQRFLGSDVDPYKVEVMAMIDDTGAIQGCFGRDSVASLCHVLGGTYYTPASGPSVCQPFRSTHISRLTTDRSDCESPYRAIRISSTYYACQWSNARVLRTDVGNGGSGFVSGYLELVETVLVLHGALSSEQRSLLLELLDLDTETLAGEARETEIVDTLRAQLSPEIVAIILGLEQQFTDSELETLKELLLEDAADVAAILQYTRAEIQMRQIYDNYEAAEIILIRDYILDATTTERREEILDELGRERFEAVLQELVERLPSSEDKDLLTRLLNFGDLAEAQAEIDRLLGQILDD